jgi:hypothetical protein
VQAGTSFVGEENGRIVDFRLHLSRAADGQVRAADESGRVAGQE